MRIGFTADIHIKLGQKDVPVDWARNRYSELFTSLADWNDSLDLWVIGGDIFDRIPTVEEMAVFFEFIQIFSIPTLMYAGNHEALKKTTTFLSYLKQAVKRSNKNVTIIDDFYSDDVIDIIPYNKLKEYHPADIDFHNKILCTHVRGEIPPHVKPEINLDLLERWDVVLAGDLHSYDNCQRNILYPGSPVTTSFHRNKVKTGFIILDSDTLEHEWIELKLPQLIRKTITAEEVSEVKSSIDLSKDHVIYEVEGNITELSSIEDNELISKKVLPRDEDTSLVLDASMSISQEVEEYLRYILLLSDTEVDLIMKELADAGPTIGL